MHNDALIFIVDDVQENIRLLACILSRKGYKISFATTGGQAIEMAADVNPDLILLDVVMPDTDGFSVCKAIKADPATRHIPVIFLTAEKTEPADVVRGLEAGGADYLNKPFDMAELLARVRIHLDLKRANDKLKAQAAALRESEQRYRAVVEDQTELIRRFRPDGTLTFVNDACCRYFGKTREEMVGQNFLDMLPEEDREKMKIRLASMTPRRCVKTTEHRVIDRNGEIRWQRRTDRAISGENGRISEFQTVSRDITERVYAEEAYRSLVDHSLQGMCIIRDRKCVFANRRMAEITGYSPEKLTRFSSDRFSRIIHPEDRDRTLAYFSECVAGRPVRHRTRMIRKDGKVCCLDIQAVAVTYRGKAALQMALIDSTRLAELESLLAERTGFGNFVGKSVPMQQVYNLIKQLAATDITVILTGETGTGKELAAEAIHFSGPRSQGPLIRVNCAAFSENLIESELFGHVRGAFTGADRDKDGRFHAAQGGTIFLDEIGELPLRLQTRLLRVLESREFQRVGDGKSRKTDARIIAATNADLNHLTQEGLFRQDLYYRLRAGHIRLPPLRERIEDIPLLTNHFTSGFCQRHGKNNIRVADAVYEALRYYSWPGNVRELKNALEFACALCPDDTITPDQLPPEFQEEAGTPDAGQYMSANVEREAITDALEETLWHKSRTAALLNISRSTLYRKLREYKISRQ
ncbi:sigma-54-dependent Fis family transcriptional re gulator [Desulfonema ishimotonii]|uniref:Sigma-54-dependent Fis family transcriptional re gulator n=1 Tax=Desulfonema ishimotonii TaxID=45657 RepID=A0A401FVU2_9BACT|nr:sigma 54-interacting transcriptional regulator [Desulfonema ishimotonii]GBC61097.1 sigma-54-dependent Fis family transcriptional re gulator [Desulfonema ishimotonii]